MPAPITFEVIDVSCEAVNRSFFVPQIKMATKSQSKFATLFGYSEFTNPSSPPKKYRTVIMNGTSERVAFTAEQSARQCGGAKYVYSGIGQVDLQGHQLSNYSKKFFAQCSKQFWPNEALVSNNLAIRTDSGVASRFVSFCWPPISSSCAVCDPNDLNWPFIGEQSTNNLIVDLQAFIKAPPDPIVTQTTWTANDVFHGLTMIVPDTSYTFTLFGTDLNNYTIPLGSVTLTARAVVTNPPSLDFPPIAIKDSNGNFFTELYIVFTDSNNYSATLQDEYTDQMALDNAQVINSSGAVAQNLPRTTGFTSVFTTVTFTLTCLNLINGQGYTATVDFFDTTAGTTTTKQYPFAAQGLTFTITDTIPTPPAGHSVIVRNPTISFAF